MKTNDTADLDPRIQQALAQLRGVYEILPEFVPAPTEGATVLRTAGTIPDAFLEASAFMVEKDPSMQAPTGLDPARTREVIYRNLRFEAVAEAAEALARDVRYNMLRERWEVVQQALQVYGLAKTAIRNPRGVSLVAYVRAMKEALGPRGRRPKENAAAPEPENP
ncbi:MAG: hypothetical protein QOE82_578 [Thermoanaerobaculia bacterium]|jgi:hypothetical protein|nr:hypothetical protein [Thermoanaerobaculia bacterium]